ncbi:MAG: S8 family serine peptidase [Geminicoccaceae bacterium]
MNRRHTWAAAAALALLGGALAPAGEAWAGGERFIARAGSAEELAARRAALVASGAEIVKEIPELNLLVVVGGTAAPSLRSAPGGTDLIPDRITRISPPDGAVARQERPGLLSARRIELPGAAQGGIRPDPAFGYRGLLWNYQRIGLPEGWEVSAGNRAVTVGVADTGLDFTHVDLKPSIVAVKDFTLDDRPSACEAFLGKSAYTDRELAAKYGGPVSTDWNGHGSWIGGNIAAALNGTGINGIAPKAKLVSLKIAENCGYAYDSDILDSFTWAARNGVDIVSISFGGYVDRRDPDQDAIYDLYLRAVDFARARGTVVVAAAGNEHLRLGAGGKVLSHGPLTTPGTSRDDFFDYFGLYETPGGIPGVVAVSSTGNRVIPSSAGCAPGTIGTAADYGDTATCKPRGDRHQAAGQGLADQLAYYSNYGPRVDVAAPGGARKFNLPYWDRGGTPGFPYVTADLTKVWEEFSTTSNWATEIPCFTFAKGTGFTPDQCYSSIQGTSMATPHVSAVLALIASARPALRGKPDRLVAALKASTRGARNLTQVLSASDRSKGDLGGPACDSGYCHLGGPAVSNADAYGAGIVVAPQRSPTS